MTAPLQPESEKEMLKCENAIRKHLSKCYVPDVAGVAIPGIMKIIEAYIQANYISKDRVREAVDDEKELWFKKDTPQSVEELMEYTVKVRQNMRDDLKTKLEIE